MGIFKNIILYILSIQEKMLTKKLSRTVSVKNMSKSRKIYSQGCFVDISSLAEAEKTKMEEELELILKVANYIPQEILKYVECQGTSVYIIKNAGILRIVHEVEGFIYPQNGFKALIISLFIQHKFCFSTPEMFVLTENAINEYNFIYHFYNWYAYKHRIWGVDCASQELLNRYLYSDDINSLQLDDIYKLKDAIAQDRASIEFVINLCKKYESSKKALNKIKDNGANL